MYYRQEHPCNRCVAAAYLCLGTSQSAASFWANRQPQLIGVQRVAEGIYILHNT